MTVRLLVLISLLLCSAAGNLHARDPQADQEIEHLLGYVEKSDARFIRNGTEYSAKEGADHLRDKLKSAGERVKTAEDFITGVATKSYLSGKPYLVKTKDGGTRPVGPWLAEALAAHRKTAG